MAEEAQPSTVSVSPSPLASDPGTPLWHTALLVFILFGLSALSYFTSRRFLANGAGSAVPSTLAMAASYAATLVEEWFLFFFVLWGERIRSRVPVRERVGIHAEKDAVWRDIGIAALVLVSLWVLGGVLVYVLHPERGTQVIGYLLPRNLAELALFVPLAISAGFCEEYIFRGYLMRQFSSLTGSVWAGLIIQAAIFGLAHGYQGFRLMSVIFCYGLIFGTAAILRKSLRPGMFAHGFLDFFSGFMGFILHLMKVKIL